MSRFVEKWCLAEYPPEPVSEAELWSAEDQLGVRLPADFREAVLQVGLPRPTVALLDAIVERELDVISVGDFYSPKEIVEETLGWRQLGMPEELVAFAGDGSGNKFCFDGARLKKGGGDAGAVWFFDHDFGTVEYVAPSFTAWISAFCDVEPLPGTELG